MQPTTPAADACSLAPPGRRLPRAIDPASPVLDIAENTPREDSVYPAYGDPSVDVLHYLLDLTWSSPSKRLSGVEHVTLRPTADDTEIALALSSRLRVRDVRLGSRMLPFTHSGDQLRVSVKVKRDKRIQLKIRYSGIPRPVPGPSTRADSERLGLVAEPNGDVWTSQEPYGAFTWYAVNDQPADKALYDIVVRVRGARDSGQVGIANGMLRSCTSGKDGRTTWWQLADPAASYLTALAIGPYAATERTTRRGFPIDLWTRPMDAALLPILVKAPKQLEWLEARLGPYPFASLGIVVTDMDGAMETQTLVTMSSGLPPERAPLVLVHELAHQWYGDLVTPADWRDVWMNEGMALYLQWLYADEFLDEPLDSTLATARAKDAEYRAEAGPPGDYDPTKFALRNVYVSPALMWDALRRKVGDRVFWDVVSAWPRTADGTGTRAELFAFIEKRTGRELSSFFDAWIMGTKTPHA